MKQEAGFTLVEVMVALGIFAIVGVMSTGLLVSTLDARSRQDEAARQLAQLQQVRAVWREDVAHMIIRPHRTADGGYDGAALTGPQAGFGRTGALASFTRRGRANPSGAADRSGLIRVEWRVEDGVLVREVWTVVDPAPGSQPHRMVLAESLNDVQIRFRYGRNWLEALPQPGRGESAPMPSALELAYTDARGLSIEHVALTSLGSGGAS